MAPFQQRLFLAVFVIYEPHSLVFLIFNLLLVMPNVISLMGLSAKMNYVQEAILDNDSVLKNAESNIVENQSANSNDLGNKIENVKNELKELITKIDS